MGTEQIFKLQPDRTLYLRGFTGVGAAAALCKTSPTGFTVCGVYRDMADFCVLNVYDADNNFEHYSVRYLPDFDLSGLKLTFDVSYRGLQPLDSAKYSWIDWASLDVIRQDQSSQKIRLWEYAQLISSNHSVAAGSCTFGTGPSGCIADEQLTLVVNNVQFQFRAKGGESGGEVAAFFESSINSYNWSTFQSSSIAVMALSDSNGRLTLKNARAGQVFVAGNNVFLLRNGLDEFRGVPFSGLSSGSPIFIGARTCSVATVNNASSLTLAQAPSGVFGNSYYLAEYGGIDGNEVRAYTLANPGNASLSVDTSVISLSNGNSNDVVWRITIDFTTLGIDKIRQAWITFAPQLANSAAYQDTEWSATFTNWIVDDPLGTRRLKCAGLASLRVNGDDARNCVYSGAGWRLLAANNYQHGFAQGSSTTGDSVTLTYTQAVSHDLYLGTSLYPGRGKVAITLDGVALPDFDCDLTVDSELMTRRLLQKSIPAGTHTVSITVISSGNQFIFDYLEAAVPADFPDAPIVYDSVSPALDYDTDATYKISPQRLLWHLLKLGFRGQLNEYLGVFWWNQRKRASGYNGVDVLWNSAAVTFSGTWTAGETVTLRIGGNNGFAMQKLVTAFDSVDTIASHFVYYLNAASVSMWAERTGPAQFTIHTRTPNWGDSIDAGSQTDARIAISGNINSGVDGTWVIDAAASNAVNFPVRQWHSDLFKAVKNAGLLITTALSMELVNPPDDGSTGNEWLARFADHKAVKTDTGFSSLFSSHCAPIANVTEYQKSAYEVIAGLQAEAGLIPWLQFGEFLWWFFASTSTPVGYCSYTDPISIGVADPHGLQTGDSVEISGVAGCPAANGKWTITVTDTTHFTIPVSADGAWAPGTGALLGSMGFYDSVTTAAARTALGRPLEHFTSQDDDAAVNGGADAAFLTARLKAHVDAIRVGVLAAYPQTKFEILYPNDVNNPNIYLGQQGGRLNAAINLPPQWRQKEGSGFDRFKVEALSWGTTYLNLSLAEEAITFSRTAPMQWTYDDTAYLVPWQNGKCPWPAEYHLAKNFVPLVNFWAYDHLALMSWPLPFPTHGRRATQLG